MASRTPAANRVEIYVLNFNGAKYLEPCIESLLRLDKAGFEVGINIVDNSSTDNSRQIVESFPEVQWIGLRRNGGFSAGNNAGVRIRKRQLAEKGLAADIHAFLNNDTAVEPGWLRAAMASFEDPEVGIVGSKALFMLPFADAHLEFLANGREIPGLRLSPEPELDNILGFGHGSRLTGVDAKGYLRSRTLLLLAPEDAERPAAATLVFSNPLLDGPVTVQARGGIDDRLLGTCTIPPRRDGTLKLSFSSGDFGPFVQNAGNYLLPNLDAGDRGYEERDVGQFDQPEEVDAICGVSLFIRDEIFTKLGGFDERYFEYYEDVDLSLRMRLLGYKCLYQPGSVLRHVHSGSVAATSDRRVRNVIFSKLLFKSKLANEEQWAFETSGLRQRMLLEQQAYLVDHNLANKPNYCAYLRMLKQRYLFARNRANSKPAWALTYKGKPPSNEQAPSLCVDDLPELFGNRDATPPRPPAEGRMRDRLGAIPIVGWFVQLARAVVRAARTFRAYVSKVYWHLRAFTQA